MRKITLLLLPIFLASCSGPACFEGVLKNAKKLQSNSLTKNETQSLKSFSVSFNQFACDFMGQYFDKENKGNNNVLLSPLTVYECLSFAKECTNGNTKAELDYLIGSYNNLSKETLHKAFNYDKAIQYDNLPNQYQLAQILDDSIWIDSNISYKQDCVDHLADECYVSSYKTDFKNNAKESSKKINDYCFKNTNGFLNPDFSFGSETYFTLISSYYLKALWNEEGNELSQTPNEHVFTNNDKTVRKTKLNCFDTIEQTIFTNEDCSSFVINDTTNTIGCYFILPNENKNIAEVMIKKNVLDVLSYDYSTSTNENYYYETRCLFPSFNIENNVSIAEEIYRLGIKDLFTSRCDFTKLTDQPIWCDDILHVNKIDVNRSGIEGASITAMTISGAVQKEDERETIRQEFVVDKAFGFVITSMNIPVFMGIVNTIN